MKTILIILLSCLTIGVSAQTKKSKQVAKPDTAAKRYIADPKAVYQLSGTEDQTIAVLSSASLGLDNYLMQTDIPAKQLANAKKYYQQVIQNMYQQYRQKFVADSLASTKKPGKS